MNNFEKKVLNYPFKLKNKKEILIDFFFPEKDNNPNKPLVLYCHGGGWSQGDKEKAQKGIFKKVHEGLLENGFCIASVGYDKGEGIPIRECVTDCKDALRFIFSKSKELGVDTKNIFVFGDSSGGQIAQVISFTGIEDFIGDSKLKNNACSVSAVVSWYAPVDFTDKKLMFKNELARNKDRFRDRIMAGANLKEEQQRREEISSITYLSESTPPLLVIHGEEDETIPVKHARLIRKKAEEKNAKVKVLVIKNAGHNWRATDEKISIKKNRIIKQTIDFFVKNIKS
ncbi:MAG: alpha/beta hydrolase [Candidatus Marinimicrobia bacterium]|nr:alpha/beta hydrolase [Candidatus Neomarinimicrobiota bacterium]